MYDIKLTIQDHSIDYQKILFERPISRLHTKHIGVIASRDIKISKLNNIFQIVNDFKPQIPVLAEPEIKQLGIPADLFLSSPNKKSVAYSNSDAAIEILSNCNLSILGIGFDQNSKMQLLFEEIFKSTHSTLVIYPKCLDMLKTSGEIFDNREGDILLCNNDSINKLIKHLGLDMYSHAGSSITKTAEILTVVANKIKGNLVFFQKDQILLSIYNAPGSIGVINLDNKSLSIPSEIFVAIFTSLLCDIPDIQRDIMLRFLTTGYLLKKYLNDYSNFKNALK